MTNKKRHYLCGLKIQRILEEKTVKKIIVFIGLICFFSLFTKADEWKDMKSLVNYKRMNAKHKKNYLLQRKAQYSSWKENKIPAHFRIPTELQSYRGSGSVRYYTIYNKNYETGIGYVPSDLARIYEEEAWFAFQKYGKDAPSLSIILAQQFTESAFNPHAVGDNNMSYGLPQLYRTTAQHLYKVDKVTWKNIFYFDKYGKHHFRSIRAMIQFPFIFLTKEKKYSLKNKFQGIKRYNGSGEDAILYAEKVIKRSLFYEEMFAKHNPVALDTSNFKKNLFGLINLSLKVRGQNDLSNEAMNYVFENMLITIEKGCAYEDYLSHLKVNSLENKPMKINHLNHIKIPIDNKDYYLIVEDGCTLYSYFKNTGELIKTLNHNKNKEFYLYYQQNNKKIKITNTTEIKNKKVFTNVLPGNKIYIPSGIVIYKPNTNFAVMMK